jgi:hypothetical protein
MARRQPYQQPRSNHALAYPAEYFYKHEHLRAGEQRPQSSWRNTSERLLIDQRGIDDSALGQLIDEQLHEADLVTRQGAAGGEFGQCRYGRRAIKTDHGAHEWPRPSASFAAQPSSAFSSPLALMICSSDRRSI